MGVFIFSIVISLLCFWASGKLISLYFKVRNWAKVRATVISKRVELHKKISSRNTPYAVRIEYKYSIDGKEYTNDKVHLAELIGGQANYMQSSANKIVNSIKDTVDVYVDPKNPQTSVLFCSGIGIYFLILFIGMISWLIGMSFL